MLRKWGTIVLLLLATPVLALAQSTGKLSGRVIDASTGEGLPGANVIIDGTQMGTASDVEGNYFIIGVPVGTYDITASFVGYTPVTVTGVEINANYTREQDFTLTPGQELEEIVVEYERPMIQKDAIGASRVVTREDIENLPVRGVTSVASLQGGVVGSDGTSNLWVRGGRDEEIAFYVDGVKVTSNAPGGSTPLLGVPQQAIQEQEMLIGTIPARFGDVMSGVVSITTRTGSSDRFFGSAEAITSEVLDSYGYYLGSLSLGGPIIPNKASFFVSVEDSRADDASPFALDTYRLSDDALTSLRTSPQVLQVIDADGTPLFRDNGEAWVVPFPADIEPGIGIPELAAILEERGLLEGVPDLSVVPQFATNFLSANDFVKERGKENFTHNLDLTGNLLFTPTGDVSLRVGGAWASGQDETYNYVRSLYAPDRFYNVDDQTWRVFGNWRHHLSNSTFYELNASFSDYRYRQYPNGFSDDIRESLFYADVDGMDAAGNQTPAYGVNALARNYWNYTDAGTFERRFSDGSLPGGAGVYSLFSLPGVGLNFYDKMDQEQFRASANITTQLGLHQIEFGGEYEQRTERRYTILSASQYARYFNDGTVEAGADKAVDSYDDLPYEVVKSAIQNWQWYGYDYLGLEETDEMDVDAFARGENLNTAPYQPIYYAGYIQDKLEFRDLVINAGIRVDVFDNNTQVLKDPYAVVPIVRVSDLTSADLQPNTVLPSNIGSDWAAYFRDGKRESKVVGYRDLEGRFYDASGEERAGLNEIEGNPNPVAANAPFSTILEDYEPQVTFMPRIGVSFPVTDQALFFASYNVTSQRPSQLLFVSPGAYSTLGQEIVANPNLKPEKTVQYELGIRQRLGERAALQLSGFYRTQSNKIATRNFTEPFPASAEYTSYYNLDFTTTKGATMEFDLRRSNNVSVNANYTLQFAQGTGSDAATLGTIAWRGNYYPDFISPASFDRRHTFNVTLDYRLGKGEGPMLFGGHPLEDFGVNVLATVASGMPYTQFKNPIRVPIFENITDDIRGGINEAYMGWTNRIDLRIDRRFSLGGRASLMAFLWVQNLLDVDNVLGVYRGTGLPDDDGFLASTEGQNAVAGALNPQSYLFHYQYFLQNPQGANDGSFAGVQAFGLPRRTRLGLRLTF